MHTYPVSSMLVPITTKLRAEQVRALKALSKRKRVPMSEYLREAVDDVITKYEER